MEGDTLNWTDWINSDAGSDAQPQGFEENQGDLGAENSRVSGSNQTWLQDGASRAALPDLSFGPLSLDQTWPLNDSIVPAHPFTRWPSPSMLISENLNGQQHVQQTSLSRSAIYAEVVPPKYVNYDSWSDCAVLEDIAGIEQPQVDSCLTRPESEDENHDQPHLDPIQKCSCMNCRLLGTQEGIPRSGSRLIAPDGRHHSPSCRFPACQERFRPPTYGLMGSTVAQHERSHFGKAGDYHCLGEGCKTITKKFADLRRHCLNKHCTNATKFPCPVLGCKYGGDNGFTRKDKLTSHQVNVHQGKVVPGKPFQLIKPKANGAKVIKSMPQGIHAIKPKPNAGA